MRIGEQRGEKCGEQRGKQLGERIGEQRGKAAVLLTQITLKFGEPPPAVVKRVNNAEIEQLDVWIRRILTATSLAELFA